MLDRRETREDLERAVANMRRSVASVAHPRWSPSLDLKILTQRSLFVPLDLIAEDLGLDTIAVTARWHVLRIHPRLTEDLAAYVEVFGDSYGGLL